MELILATHNLHKILEFKAMLKDVKNLEVFSLRDFPEYSPPEETGTTFEENAKLKALHAAKALQKRVLADDSGLVVPSLDGAPGVLSRRYAGADATDKDNRAKLLQQLQDLPEHKRNAYFQCCLVLATPEGIEKIVNGFCEGSLQLEEKGRNGFGYDSLFVKYDYNKTLAELDTDTKNKISHRRKALDKLGLY
ncbi:MAG: XTP/dITP diphosphatase [Simkaniaceae bacterium]|nr:XTP/dITP diphosphatase [Simkaniaceae bacterium]